MSKLVTGEMTCRNCGHLQDVQIYSSVNVSLDPELRDRFMNGQIFKFICDECKQESLLPYEVMYHDMDNKFVVWLVPSGDFLSKLKEISEMPFEIEYFQNALFTQYLPEAMALVMLCEKHGAPETEQRHEEYQNAAKSLSRKYINGSDDAKADTDPENLYHIFDEASLITIIGQTGSGKSQLIFSYLDHVTKRYTPDEFLIRAYDLVRVDYWEKEPVMSWTTVASGSPDGYESQIQNDLKLVKDRITGSMGTDQRILIHINECDLFVNEPQLREKTIELCTLIAKHGKTINVQLIYETSRPAEPALPKLVVDMSDVRVLCPVANTSDAHNFVGEIDELPQEQGEMLVQTNNPLETKAFELNLPR